MHLFKVVKVSFKTVVIRLYWPILDFCKIKKHFAKSNKNCINMFKIEKFAISTETAEACFNIFLSTPFSIF